MMISIIVPAYNEEGNVVPTYDKIKNDLGSLDYEIVFVNDGSTDGTKEELGRINDKGVRVIDLKENKGKSFALDAGIRNAKYDVIVTLDADLQSDPKDILKLLNKMDKGYDLVCGRRERRNDGFVKKVYSKIGNNVYGVFFGCSVKDNNCPLKVFKKECVKSIIFCRNIHRLLPVLVKLQGYKVCEEEIKDRPRVCGKSKYGISNRIFVDVKMLFLVKFNLGRFLRK